MSLAPGTRVGAYEVLGAVGAGGMGVVYRARDTKLDRHVAIKVLPASFVADPDRRARFEREGRALASLNHPNIAQVYGIEEAGDTPAIVMEFVDGEDLAARIARGPLAWPEALPLARQIAQALDAAHERGIVHRDLKPANIKVTPDDSVKVLDFGLAKAVGGAASDVIEAQNSPTFTSASTQAGVIMGTAAYMSPEQAKGRTVDKRADIWAFGCVLFEMLTGRSPFGGDSVAESLALVITRDPDLAALPSNVPRTVVTVIRRCLVKDPRQRLRDIGDASYVLTHLDDDDPVAPAPAAPRRRRTALILGAATAALLAIAAAAIAWYAKPVPDVPLRRLELPAAIGASTAFALAPDGTRIAYLSDARLYVHAFDALAPRELAAVPAVANALFWSADGSTIGFVAEGTIRTIPADGGPIFTVCRVPSSGRAMGVDWRADGTIVFSVWRDHLYKVAASGGTPEVLVPADPTVEVDFHSVAALPDNRVIVSVHLQSADGERVDLIDGTSRTTLTNDSGVRAMDLVAGQLIFLRTDTNPGVWAMPFSSPPYDVTRATLIAPGATGYDATADGTLVARVSPPTRDALVWLDRAGTVTPIPGPPIADIGPALGLSPDDSRVAWVAGQRDAGHGFVRDLHTGVDTRITPSDAAAQGKPRWVHSNAPGWLPAGDRVLLSSGPIGAMQQESRRADGGGGEVVVGNGRMSRVSSDSKWIVWLVDERGRGLLRYAPLGADGKAGAVQAVAGIGDVDVTAFDLSAGAQLLAYTVRETNLRNNVHVVTFPDGLGHSSVTTDGSTAPRFSRDGRELLYVTDPRERGAVSRLMVAPVTRNPSLKIGAARPFVADDAKTAGLRLGLFDVARDGRVVVARRVSQPTDASRALLIQNWPAALSKR